MFPNLPHSPELQTSKKESMTMTSTRKVRIDRDEFLFERNPFVLTTSALQKAFPKYKIECTRSTDSVLVQGIQAGRRLRLGDAWEIYKDVQATKELPKFCKIKFPLEYHFQVHEGQPECIPQQDKSYNKKVRSWIETEYVIVFREDIQKAFDSDRVVHVAKEIINKNLCVARYENGKFITHLNSNMEASKGSTENFIEFLCSLIQGIRKYNQDVNFPIRFPLVVKKTKYR